MSDEELIHHLEWVNYRYTHIAAERLRQQAERIRKLESEIEHMRDVGADIAMGRRPDWKRGE